MRFPHRIALFTLHALLWSGSAAQAQERAQERITTSTTPAGTLILSNLNEDAAAPAPSPSHASGFVAATPYWHFPDKPLLRRVAKYRDLVAKVASKTDVDTHLLHAVIAVESAYDPEAVSPQGAVGLMQLMPDTARRFGITDRYDPGQNILGGATYLRILLDRFSNDLGLVLAAYNAGEGAVIRHGMRIPPYRETIAYVPRVLAIYHRLKSLAINDIH